jgi:lipoprotein-anchoring transpeptidase ErfK/SrfK
MPVSRRGLLTTMISSMLFSGRDAVASGSEPFPIKTSEAKDVSYKFQRRAMAYETQAPPGTIVIDPVHCFLYHISDGGMAMRYGVSVGKGTKAWSGEVTIKKMTEWPVWTPAPYHLEHMPSLAKWKDGMPGGPENPLGARAMYLYKGEVDTINRIHGAAKPEWIGKKATAGCISLLNVDVVHLYSQVQVGTRVVMLG